MHGGVRGGAAQHGGLVDLAALPGIQEKNKNKNSYCLHKNHIFFARASSPQTTISHFAANIYFDFCRKVCGEPRRFCKMNIIERFFYSLTLLRIFFLYLLGVDLLDCLPSECEVVEVIRALRPGVKVLGLALCGKLALPPAINRHVRKKLEHN